MIHLTLQIRLAAIASSLNLSCWVSQQDGKEMMTDSLDDLDFPHIANGMFEACTVTQRRPKPPALGVVKQWRFIFHMENGRQECIGPDYVGTESEAMWEGENRLFKHEHNGGETPASIEVQSQGKPNSVTGGH